MSTLVQATDRKLYMDPVLYGEDWYLRFTEDGPEIAIRVRERRHARRVAKIWLSTIGVKYKLLSVEPLYGTHCFPPDHKFEKAHSFYLRLDGPIPPPRLHHGVTDFPSSEARLLAWELPFTAAEVAIALGDPASQSFIVSFVGRGKGVTAAKRAILKQYPALRGLKTEVSVKDRVGATITLRGRSL